MARRKVARTVQRRPAPRAPKKPQQLRLRSKEAVRARALQAVRLMRSEGLSLSGATRRAHTSARTVLDYAGSAIGRREGHYFATKRDALPRMMRFVTPDGVIALQVRNSRQASRIGRYWAAVQRYLLTGRTEALRPFRGRTVRTGKVAYPFITDPRTLERVAHAGELRFEELYVHAV